MSNQNIIMVDLKYMRVSSNKYILINCYLTIINILSETVNLYVYILSENNQVSAMFNIYFGKLFSHPEQDLIRYA